MTLSRKEDNELRRGRGAMCRRHAQCELPLQHRSNHHAVDDQLKKFLVRRRMDESQCMSAEYVLSRSDGQHSNRDPFRLGKGFKGERDLPRAPRSSRAALGMNQWELK